MRDTDTFGSNAPDRRLRQFVMHLPAEDNAVGLNPRWLCGLTFMQTFHNYEFLLRGGHITAARQTSVEPRRELDARQFGWRWDYTESPPMLPVVKGHAYADERQARVACTAMLSRLVPGVWMAAALHLLTQAQAFEFTPQGLWFAVEVSSRVLYLHQGQCVHTTSAGEREATERLLRYAGIQILLLPANPRSLFEMGRTDEDEGPDPDSLSNEALSRMADAWATSEDAELLMRDTLSMFTDELNSAIDPAYLPGSDAGLLVT